MTTTKKKPSQGRASRGAATRLSSFPPAPAASPAYRRGQETRSFSAKQIVKTKVRTLFFFCSSAPAWLGECVVATE